jgi:predicted O-methyltransferase YrrM
VNGSYRQLFADLDVQYIGLDLAAEEGVDVVLDDPYTYPLESGSVDLVISGQMLEHCEYFWRAFEEMARLLAPDGFLLLIAPSAGPIHRYPVDCYRFYPDAYRALAKLVGCTVVALWQDDRGPWRDLVGVFSRNPEAAGREIIRDSSVLVANFTVPSDPDEERVAGQQPYLETLALIHETLAPRIYIEIGVRSGSSLALAKCEAVAIDPAPRSNLQLDENVSFHQCTSDDFFDLEATDVIKRPIDMAFIDGMHLFEHVLRDFIHVEQRCHPASVIVIDDIYPNTPGQASRERSTRVWTGDVWKIVPCLQEARPDLTLLQLDTFPTGMLVVLGLKPGNTALRDRYNPIIRKYRDAVTYRVPPEIVLNRMEGISPLDPILVDALTVLFALRSSNLAPAAIRGALKKVLDK